MTSTLITLGISFAGLSGLYALRAWELSRGGKVLPRMRRMLDIGAVHVFAALSYAVRVGQALPHLVVYGVRRIAFIAVLLLAAIARGIEGRAHNLARIIAHPYRRTGRNKKSGNGSAFLQEVAAHKEALDTREEADKKDESMFKND